MPSENRRRKDDTWTAEELDKALKGPKNDMERRRKREDDGDRRRHRDDVNGSDRRRKDDDKKSHRRDEDDRKSKRHKDRGDSEERVKLTEDERERQRQERRAKREGGKEEKKSRPKESKSVNIIDEDDDRKRRHRDRDDDRHSERRHHKEDESRRKDKDKERRHEKDKERRHHEDGDRDRERRHRDNVDDDRRRRHRDEESSSRRHKDEGDRHNKERREEESEEDRERRRQERREKREREKQKDKEKDREKERSSHRRSEKTQEEERSERRHHDRSEHERDGSRHERDRDRESRHERDPDRRSSKYEEETKVTSPPSNGRHNVEEDENDNDDDEYNYEEDFEDYEDDFEDEEDSDMKQEGEMEEVLRALDEENNRIIASQRSNWSGSTELSDERFRDVDEEAPAKKAVPKGKTFINFVSAKQRVMDHTIAGKARKRFEDISKLVELDVAKYDMFDLPPVKEYELYIRSFGRSDTKQAYVQTHDDDIDRDIQTDEIESLSKWTQHPPDDDTAVGGEGINVEAPDSNQDIVKKTDPAKITQFLERVGQFLFTILDEESKSYADEERKRDGRPTASFSERVTQLGHPNFLKDRHVVALSFCQAEPNYLLSVHTAFADDQETTEDISTIRSASPVEGEKLPLLQTLSVICVWNLSQPTYPYRICTSAMKVTCACFSPTKASLVFGGMQDGSVALWDLREPASQHRSLEIEGEEHLVRFPTYNTAGVAEIESHYSPVVAIVPVYSQIVGSQRDEETAESSSGLSFQLASVEEKAILNLWVIAEISVPDPAGSENDLGLSPGGKIKLLKSSSIVLTNPNKYLATSEELKALDLHLNPGDLNHFYVGTDAGCVVHGVRFGKRAHPHSHSSLVDSPVPVVSLDFSPFGQPYFLAGCEDGTLHLYNTTLENPVATWRQFVSGEKILSVRWSHSRPAVFFVLDNNSTVFTFDLVENGLGPIKMDRITAADATLLEVGGDPNLINLGTSRPAHMVLALDNGSTEVLSISEEMRQQQPLEEDFLASYIDRF